jgi:hypothetical protein
MPRQKAIVMNGTTPEQLRESVIKAAIEKYEPYRVFKDPVGEDFAIVYIHPSHQTRTLIARRNQRTNAIKLREMLERAWAEGRATKAE